MPVALAPMIIGAGASLGITIPVALGNILAYAVVAGAGIGLSLLTAGKRETSPGQIQVKEAVSPRIRGYGRAKLGGALFFIESVDGWLYRGIIHCEGPIDGIEIYYWNDQPGGMIPPDPWSAVAGAHSYPGNPWQPADPLLQSIPGAAWSPAHQLNGLAYTVITCGGVKEEKFARYYPNGAPNVSVVARLCRVSDPRNGVLLWSDNPALCIMDYLIHPRGYNIPQSRINTASFAGFATICDQPVELKNGGTEPRYRLSGTYELTDEPRNVLRRMLATCDAEIVPLPDGTIGIRGGIWQEPDVILNDEHITSYTYEQGSDRFSGFNRLQVSFTSPNHDYQLVETQSWDDINNQNLRGEILTNDLALDFVPSHGQSRRLAKIAMFKGNPRHKMTIQTNMAGLQALGESVLRLQLSELNIDAVFQITRFEILEGMAGCSIQLSSLAQSAYQWNAALEEGEPPAPLSQEIIHIPPPGPRGVRLEMFADATPGGLSGLRLRIRVTELTGRLSNYVLLGQYRKPNNPDPDEWINLPVSENSVIETDFLEIGVPHQFRLAHAGWGGFNSGNIGEWTPEFEVTLKIREIIRVRQPQNLTGSRLQAGDEKHDRLEWGSSPDAALYRIYRSEAADYAGAWLMGSTDQTSYEMVTPHAQGVYPRYYYFVEAVDAFGFSNVDPATFALTWIGP